MPAAEKCHPRWLTYGNPITQRATSLGGGAGESTHAGGGAPMQSPYRQINHRGIDDLKRAKPGHRLTLTSKGGHHVHPLS